MEMPNLYIYANRGLFENSKKVSPRSPKTVSFLRQNHALTSPNRWPAVSSNVVHGETE